MPNFTVSIAAATAIVNYDLFKDTVWQRVSQNRILTGLAVMGSAAAGDTEIEVYVAETRIGNFFNLSTGFPTKDHLLPLEGLFVPGGTPVRAIVKDAPVTNPINVMIALRDL